MAKMRLVLLLVLLAIGGTLVVQLARERVRTPLESTLSRTYQVLGRPVQSLDRAFSRVIPVDSLDEKEFGDAIASRYAAETTGDPATREYLEELVGQLAVFAKKPFNYRVFLLRSEAPNACALPGGVILVTEGLLDALGSESELVAVLAHEMGHIERGHCFDAVKFQVFFKKVHAPTLGMLVDLAVGAMLHHSFSKTQENEADDYAFALLSLTRYDPAAVGKSFGSLQAWQAGHGGTGIERSHADPVRDYFMSHPPLVLRLDKYTQAARVWRRNHPGEKRYVGIGNLQRRESLYRRTQPGEWRGQGSDGSQPGPAG
jgi:predicted Zn-dependent protease